MSDQGADDTERKDEKRGAVWCKWYSHPMKGHEYCRREYGWRTTIWEQRHPDGWRAFKVIRRHDSGKQEEIGWGNSTGYEHWVEDKEGSNHGQHAGESHPVEGADRGEV